MRLLDLAGLVLVTVVWGVNMAVLKAGVEMMPPIALIALRLLAVALVLAPFMKWPPPRWLDLLAIAVVLGVIHFSLLFSGLAGIDTATASIAIQLQVPFAALLAALLFRDRLGWRRFLGMIVAFAGVAVIAGAPRFDGDLTSLLLVIAGAFAWALSNVMVKRLGNAVDVWTLAGWVALLAAPQLALLSWAMEDGQVAAIGAAGWELWAWLAFQVLAVTLFGYGVWYACMRRYSVNQVMPLTLLVPLFGVLSGVVGFGDRLTGPMIVGGLATVAGVAVIVLHRAPAAPVIVP